MTREAKVIGAMPAFPVTDKNTNSAGGYVGMTYRQLLIGMAMQGLLANQKTTEFSPTAYGPSGGLTVGELAEIHRLYVADEAVHHADAILEQLAKEVKL